MPADPSHIFPLIISIYFLFEMCMFRILHFLQPCVSDFMEPVIPPAWFNWGMLAGIPGTITKHFLSLASMLCFIQNPSRVDAKDTITGHVSAGLINVYL